MPDSRIALLDICKTNAKLVVADLSGTPNGRRPDQRRTAQCPTATSMSRRWRWLTETLSAAPNKGEIGAIVPVAHGACAALLAGDSLALPVVDYEEPATAEVAEAYAAERDPFSETFSPALPRGLNLGRQLVFQEARSRSLRQSGLHTVPSAILGLVAFGRRGIGGDFARRAYGPLAAARPHLVRPRRAARLGAPLPGDPCGLGRARHHPPRSHRRTGLSPDTRVLCGIHDSNASFLRHLARRGVDEAFAVVSTGTWTIVFANGAPLAN